MSTTNYERVQQLMAELLSLTETVPEAAESRGLAESTMRLYASLGIYGVEKVSSGARIIINPDGLYVGSEE